MLGRDGEEPVLPLHILHESNTEFSEPRKDSGVIFYRGAQRSKVAFSKDSPSKKFATRYFLHQVKDKDESSLSKLILLQFYTKWKGSHSI